MDEQHMRAFAYPYGGASHGEFYEKYSTATSKNYEFNKSNASLSTDLRKPDLTRQVRQGIAKMDIKGTLNEPRLTLEKSFEEINPKKLKTEILVATETSTLPHTLKPDIHDAKQKEVLDTEKLKTCRYIIQIPFSTHNMILLSAKTEQECQLEESLLYQTLMNHKHCYFTVDAEKNRMEVSLNRKGTFCTMWLQLFSYLNDSNEIENYICCQRSSGDHYVARLFFTYVSQSIATKSIWTDDGLCDIGLPTLTREELLRYYANTVELIFRQLKYVPKALCNSEGLSFALPRDIFSQCAPLSKMKEEAVQSVCELSIHSDFCRLLLQESTKGCVVILIEIATQHSLIPRYHACTALYNLLENQPQEMATILQEQVDMLPPLIEMLVNECTTGKYFEVHTRIACAKLLYKLLEDQTAEIVKSCSDEILNALQENVTALDAAKKSADRKSVV